MRDMDHRGEKGQDKSEQDCTQPKNNPAHSSRVNPGERRVISRMLGHQANPIIPAISLFGEEERTANGPGPEPQPEGFLAVGETLLEEG
jgi:hypothetical protein